jgi:hypothetical protein
VDGRLRLLGREDGVFALGDCAVGDQVPLPQLAQVAQQVGDNGRTLGVACKPGLPGGGGRRVRA